MSALTVAEVLDGAADLLEKPGAWTQGASYRDESGLASHDLRFCSMCALGALWQAGDETDGPATLFLESVLGTWPADWNDEPGRTQPEVVAKLREAAALAREEQA